MTANMRQGDARQAQQQILCELSAQLQATGCSWSLPSQSGRQRRAGAPKVPLELPKPQDFPGCQVGAGSYLYPKLAGRHSLGPGALCTFKGVAIQARRNRDFTPATSLRIFACCL